MSLALLADALTVFVVGTRHTFSGSDGTGLLSSSQRIKTDYLVYHQIQIAS